MAPPMTLAINPNRALWEKGDFTRIAACMRASGEALVGELAIHPGMRVLDVGCGDGTTAIPAARLGASVLGIDIASNLVAAGQRRAAEERLPNIEFWQRDACTLDGVADRGFDLVLSVFGAMFAPRPNEVAESLVRVTRPGGRIVMGNWIPGDPTLVAQILKTSSAYAPPPPEGFISPMLWGVEANVVERFVAAGIAAERIAFARRAYRFEHAGSPASFLALFRTYYGPTMNAYEAARAQGKEDALDRELSELFRAQNKSDWPDMTVIDATYLRVTVQV